MNSKSLKILATYWSVLATWGCADGTESELQVPSSYSFESRFVEGESSVSYTGQTLRHVLIADLTSYIGSLDEAVESNAQFDALKVEEALLAFYTSEGLGNGAIRLTSDPQPLQETYDDISSSKSLAEKMAGQDGNDHKDWTVEFVGWGDESIAQYGGSIDSPDGLLRAFLKVIAKNAELQANGDDSRSGLLTHQTAAGQDLQQLVQKFLLGAVAFSQGADDYLDEGLSKGNAEPEEDTPYTALEHAWDEGFGYFGASRGYLNQSDADISAGSSLDPNGDDKIDLTSEYNFGASVNAAKRDLGSKSGTDLTGEAMKAFLKGRALISAEADIELIEEQAELAVSAWEKSLAATAIHYINDTLGDMESFDTKDYDFTDHAKHWSELKGFALSFQFNPRSPLGSKSFEKLHELIGDAPVLAEAGEDATEDGKKALLEARDLLRDAYDFTSEDAENW